MNHDSNRRTATRLAMVAVLMFGFGYALVPMYNVFCEITGLNGKTGKLSEAQAQAQAKQADRDRIITVEFDTNVNSELPWVFGSVQSKMQVHPGELNEAIFYVENLSGQTVTGQAVPSVASAEASRYFNKTECFCFTRQTLGAGERIEMPVRYIIDPELPGRIDMLTLSYTFFRVPDSGENGT